MSKRRREWTESLKQGKETLPRNAKKYINVIKDETYKLVNGQLVCVHSDSSGNSMENPKEQCYTDKQDFQNINQKSPHQLQKKIGIENLTPTYRKPNHFLKETKKVMDNLTTSSIQKAQDNLTDVNPKNDEGRKTCVEGLEEDQWITKSERTSVEETDLDLQSCNLSNFNKQEKLLFEKKTPLATSSKYNSDFTIASDDSDSENNTSMDQTNSKISRRQLIFSINKKDKSKVVDRPKSNSPVNEENEATTDLNTDKKNTSAIEEMTMTSLVENVIIDSCARSFEVITQAEVYVEPIPRKCELISKSDYSTITVQANISDEITVIPNEDDVISMDKSKVVDRPKSKSPVNEENEATTDLNTDKKNTSAIEEMTMISLVENVIIDSCARSFEVITQAEVYVEPVPRKCELISKSDYSTITVQANISDEITVIPNEDDVICKDVSDEQCNKKKNCHEMNLRNSSKVNKRKNCVPCDVSYLDFMTEEDREQHLLDEAFPSEASDQENYSENGSESTSDEEDKQRKKKKKGKKNKSKTKTNSDDENNISAYKKKKKGALKKENLENRNLGESYVNYRGEPIEAKTMKPNPCLGKNCGNDCGSISEERRENLFTYFMSLKCNQRRKDWIAQCAIKSAIKRTRTKNTNRNCTYHYYINEGEGRRKVCQKFLMSTLDITQRFILYTLDTMIGGFAKTDERGKNGGYNKTKESVLNHAQTFIESLPRLPSHYCRGDSTRLYFPAEFKNITNLHRIYTDNCKQHQVKAMSFQVFRNWFYELYNIGFHIPKKDKCAICGNAINLKEDAEAVNKEETENAMNTEKEKEIENEEKTGNEDNIIFNKKADDEAKKEQLKKKKEEEKLIKHMQEKDASYKRFKYHQNIHHNDKSTICASFDMQKVLNTPHGESMTLYYSRKLAVYNFTIYESTTRKAYCNIIIWTEADAKRGADEISTCLYQYIKDVDSRGSVRTLLLYCDSCYGQNKNKTVLSMIRYALSNCENLTTIQINYLIPGHTYMPVDSVHATIEKKIKKTIVWAPSQWPTIMEVSRQDPEPYNVCVLNGKDFIGFSDVVDSTFDKKHKIAVSKLHIATLKIETPDVISIKQSMLPGAEVIDVTLLPLTECAKPKYNLYPTSLGIAPIKYKDLKKLVDKGIIPPRFASEYKNIKVNAKIKDNLVDTDEEDEVDYEEK